MKTSRTKTAALLLLLLLTLHAAHAARAQEAAAPVVVITQTQTAPAAQQPTPATQKASGEDSGARPDATAPITGRVVGEAGEPLPGVNVFAAPRSAAAPILRQPRSAASDDAGNFRFAGLEPGLYQLYASIPAYVTEPDPLTGRPGSVYRPGDNVLLRMTKGGVITGTVIDPQGEPLVGVGVRAVRVRDLDGRVPQSVFPALVEDATDDRGVYRVYGLSPGVYVVFAGSMAPGGFGNLSAYGGDAPTFYPSSTRDTAAEVTVRAGQESAGIDIRYREEQGRRVTGTVELPSAAAGENFISILLTFASTGMPAGGTGLNASSAERSFSIEGIGDGDYDLQAMYGGREGFLSASTTQRVSVKGADVTGLRVALVALGSAGGTLVIEPAAEAERARAECKALPAAAARRPQETIVTATPERPAAANRLFSRFAVPHEATPDESGAFTLRTLEAGRHHVSVRLFDEALYLRAVQQPGAAALAAPSASPRASTAAATRTAATPAFRETFDLKAGQQLSGIVVRLAEGAASLAGRVAPAEPAAAQTPAPTRLYLVPQERERAEDALHYYEAAVTAEGAFAFRNVAPGRYLVVGRAVAEAGDAAARPAAWDSAARAILRREAESANTPAELQPCQRTADFVLRFPAK